MKWAGPHGFSVDKFQAKADGSHSLDCSSTGIVNNLKVIFKGSDAQTGDLGFEYTGPSNTIATVNCDIVELSSLSASILAAPNNFLSVGGSAAYNLKGSSIDSWSAGVSYNKNNCFTSLTTNKLSSATLSTTYKVNSKLTVGSTSTHTKDQVLKKFTVGATFDDANLGLVKGKMDSDGLISAALVRKVDSKTKLTVTPCVEVNGKDLGSFKWGFGVAMG